MKRFTIILLSFLIMLPSFGSLVIYASFKMNQKEIAQRICVQRRQVFNTCNGRCELQKSIKKYSDNQKRMQDKLKDRIDLVYIQNTTDGGFGPIPLLNVKKMSSALEEAKPTGVSGTTLRPPIYFL